MAEEDLQTLEIRDDFYRDHFLKVIMVLISVLLCIAALIALSIYLYLTKPPPHTFLVQDEWRVQAAVPLEQPYLSTSDVLQWVSDVLPKSFIYDFINYNEQLKTTQPYFTDNGWKVFLNHLNIYANYTTIITNKMFVNAAPTSAPYVVNQGLLAGRYSWWIQMPVQVDYSGYSGASSQVLTLQVLVVRVSTLNNLDGVAIENVLVAKQSGDR